VPRGPLVRLGVLLCQEPRVGGAPARRPPGSLSQSTVLVVARAGAPRILPPRGTLPTGALDARGLARLRTKPLRIVPGEAAPGPGVLHAWLGIPDRRHGVASQGAPGRAFTR